MKTLTVAGRCPHVVEVIFQPLECANLETSGLQKARPSDDYSAQGFRRPWARNTAPSGFQLLMQQKPWKPISNCWCSKMLSFEVITWEFYYGEGRREQMPGSFSPLSCTHLSVPRSRFKPTSDLGGCILTNTLNIPCLSLGSCGVYCS